MKRLVSILLVVLETLSFDASAQNTSVTAPPNPKKVAEYCYHCGWVKTGESHRGDCPYVYGSSSASSGSAASSGSSVRNDPVFTAADAGINALGSILSSLVASAFEPKQSKSSSYDAPVLSAAQVADRQANLAYWIDQLFEALNPHRFAHSLSVVLTSAQLAFRFGLDTVRAEKAGLLHDCAKCFSLSEMQKIAR